MVDSPTCPNCKNPEKSSLILILTNVPHKYSTTSIFASVSIVLQHNVSEGKISITKPQKTKHDPQKQLVKWKKKIWPNETGLASGQYGNRGINLNLFQEAVSDAMTAGMATLQAKLKNKNCCKNLQEFCTGFWKDINRLMEDFTKEINQRLRETTIRSRRWCCMRVQLLQNLWLWSQK